MKRTLAKRKEIARELLVGEFEAIGRDTIRYCESLGWDKDNKLTKLAVKHANDLCWSQADINKVAKVIGENDKPDLIDVVENGKVNEAVYSCVIDCVISYKK